MNTGTPRAPRTPTHSNKRFPDTTILEECPNCGELLTLMESIRVPDGQLCLVKRCLACNAFPAVEVLEIKTAEGGSEKA